MTGPRTEVLIGLDALSGPVLRTGPTGVVVLLDGSLRESDGYQALSDHLAGRGLKVRTMTRSSWSDLQDAYEVSEQLTDCEVVITYGGGAVMDAAKMALALADPQTRRSIAAEQRCGWIMGPRSPSRLRLVCVPTTLGTASEVSAIAVFTTRSGRRVLTSRAMAPDVAVHDPCSTASLGREQVVHSLLETLLRLVGPFAADPEARPAVDAEALSLIRRQAALLSELDRYAGLDDAGRMSAADLAVRSCDASLLHGRPAFGNKAWFIGNNLAHAAGVSKMTALLTVMPAYWTAFATEPGLGSDHRLRIAWQAVVSQLPFEVSEAPGPGLAEVLTRLGAAHRMKLDDEMCDHVADSCIRMWGAGLPMLSGTKRHTVRSVLARAAHAVPAPRTSG